MFTALISLGANTPDKHAVLVRTIERIKDLVLIQAQTPIYDTLAEGNTEAASYSNALLQIATDIDYATLRATFKSWEKEVGRNPQSKVQGIIPLDVDIISWNNHVLKERDMQFAYMQQGLKLLMKAE